MDTAPNLLRQTVHRQATTASVKEVASALQALLSRRLTAYIAGVGDGKTVSRWASGEVTEIRDVTTEQRLRAAYEIAQLLLQYDSAQTVKAWFIGMNPQLDDISPAEAIHNGELKRALTAARAFIADHSGEEARYRRPVSTRVAAVRLEAGSLPPLIAKHRESINALCEEYGVKRLEVFGSVMTDAFDPEHSDVDFIVEYPEGYDFGLWLTRYFEFKDRLEALLDRSVDLIMAGAMRKPHFIESANETRQLLYAA